MGNLIVDQRALLIRAEAGSRIGIGHMIRCVALGQEWQNVGGKVIFALSRDALIVEGVVRSEGFVIEWITVDSGTKEDALQTVEIGEKYGVEWIVLDGYGFSSDYQYGLKQHDFRLLCIDDMASSGHFYADIVLNQNSHVEENRYKAREEYTELLLGSSYVQLRKQFLRYLDWSRNTSIVGNRLLITMGGSDPENGTTKILNALKKISITNLAVKVVAGPANVHYSEISAWADSKGSTSVELVKSTSNMAQLMAWADMAVICAGGTLWEALFMQMPVLSFALNDVQYQILWELEKVGAINFLGYLKNFNDNHFCQSIETIAHSSNKRQQMQYIGRNMIDGHGTERVVKTMLGLGRD